VVNVIKNKNKSASSNQKTSEIFVLAKKTAGFTLLSSTVQPACMKMRSQPVVLFSDLHNLLFKFSVIDFKNG